jgi:hypothetical protein
MYLEEIKKLVHDSIRMGLLKAADLHDAGGKQDDIHRLC